MESIQKRFEQLRHKKILIYGTGKIAENLLAALEEFHIVGIIDKSRFEGKLMNIPILVWDDIDRNTADIIIIASLRKNYKVIYERIQYYCAALNIMIYGENGQNLLKEYEFKYITPLHEKYFQKSESELKKLIEQYDAISFDLFDGLIMGRTLEIEDIFDFVEDKIRNKGIAISEFKKKRRTAQLQSNSNNIDEIYYNLRSITGISKKESALALHEEIACEGKNLVPRKVMIELLDFALKKGKRVSIIADTYFPVKVIETFLCDLNINEYDKLYLSSEDGRKTASALIESYRQDMGSLRCLHIGNGSYIDKRVLQSYGIDFYEIKSAYELMKMSSLRKLLICSGGVDNRLALGMIAAEIFNNPFILHNTSGVVKIKKPDELATLFIAPIVLIYMQNLIKVLRKKPVEAILFTARDGYLFKKIYDICYLKTIGIPSLYFLTSRKLCLRSTIDVEDDILNLYNNFSTEHELKVFLDEFLQDEFSTDEGKKDLDTREKLLLYQDKLKQKSRTMRNHYLNYMKTISFEQRKQYLFCELNSMGTIHEALNKMLDMDLEGFYLYRRMGFKERKLRIVSVYDHLQGANVDRYRDLIEVVLTSLEPSICGMDENGVPVYSPEKRTKQDLYILEILHKVIIDFIQFYVDLGGAERMIRKELPDIALGLCNYVDFEDEINVFMTQKNIDDMTQRRICVFHEEN